jgi:hypothetical protein
VVIHYQLGPRSVSVYLYLDAQAKAEPDGKILMRSNARDYAESTEGIEVIVVES